jgi:hypothetical protein
MTLVDEGGKKTSWSGKAQATMNALTPVARCIGRAEGETDDSTLQIYFGNASFDGPRTYHADDFSSDGWVTYVLPSGFTFDSTGKTSSCTLVLAEAAPRDARGSVVRGGRLSGSFSCTKLATGGGPLESDDGASRAPLVIESGVFAATVE